MTPDQVDRRLASGRWLRIHPRVYLVADRELTTEGRVRAAALWAGSSATVCGLAAAWWHGLWTEAPSIVDVTVPLRRCPSNRPGIRIRRRDLCDIDRVDVRGLWVSDVPLTVLEAATALGERGSQLLDRALQRRVRFDAMHRAHCRNLGRRGATEAGRLLAAAADRAASAAERKLIAVLRDAQITGWRLHYVLGEYELDFAFPDHRVAVEVDGWAWHHEINRFRNDRRRQNAVVLAGWTVLRFTWHDLVEHPGHVAHEIRMAIHARRAS